MPEITGNVFIIDVVVPTVLQSEPERLFQEFMVADSWHTWLAFFPHSRVGIPSGTFVCVDLMFLSMHPVS